MIMKVRNIFLKVVSIAAFTAAVVGSATILDQGRSRAAAFNPQPDPPAFGMIGITREQTARLNVVNWGDVPQGDRSGPIPSGDRPIRVELIFLDSWDNVLLRSTETL